MTDKKIKKLALLGLVIVGIITGNPVNAAAVAEVSASVVASQNDVNSVSRITYERFADSMIVKVVNVKRQDVVSVLWNGSDISSQLKKLEKSGHIIVSDDENGFTIEFDDPNLFENGEFGFSLIDKPSATISAVIRTGNLNNSEIVNEVVVSKSSAALFGAANFIVKGQVQYRKAGCLLFSCWSPVPKDTVVSIIGDTAPAFSTGMSFQKGTWKQINTTAKTDKNGNYTTSKTLKNYSCSGFTVSAKYNNQVVSQRVDQSTWFGFGGCSGTYTADLQFK